MRGRVARASASPSACTPAVSLPLPLRPPSLYLTPVGFAAACSLCTRCCSALNIRPPAMQPPPRPGQHTSLCPNCVVHPCSPQVSYEELQVEAAVRAAAEGAGARFRTFWSNTLCHLEDLPFKLQQLPQNFGAWGAGAPGANAAPGSRLGAADGSA